MITVRIPVSTHYCVENDMITDREYSFADISASEVADLLMRGFGLDGAEPLDLTTAERREVA